MKREEKILTVRNVISDLQAALEDVENGEVEPDQDWWDNVKGAAEYITEDTPHL